MEMQKQKDKTKKNPENHDEACIFKSRSHDFVRFIGPISNYDALLSVIHLKFKHSDKTTAGSVRSLISQFTAHNAVYVKKWEDTKGIKRVLIRLTR